MGDYYRDWDKHKRAAKKKRLADAEDLKSDIRWLKHTEYHWSIDLKGYRLNYWPSTGRWCWRRKYYRGTAKGVVNFIKNRR